VVHFHDALAGLLDNFEPVDHLVIPVLVPPRPDGEAGLAKIVILALATVVAFIPNGRGLADIALVVIEDVLFGVGLDAALSDDLAAEGGEGVGGDRGLELLLLLLARHLDRRLHVDVHH
jgi:hypothetical protein